MKKIKKSEFFMYLFFAIISFCKGIGLSNSNNIYRLIYIVGVLILICKIFQDKFTKKEIFYIGIILCIGIINFVFFGETTVLFSSIALSGMKNIDIKRVIKIMFVSRIIAFVGIILLSGFGVIENRIIYIYRATDGISIKRYSFGYSHPNLAHASLTIIVILWGYLYYNKINLFKLLVCEFINIVVYQFTYSRTGFIILTAYLILLYLTKNVSFIKKAIIKNLNLTFVGCIILSFVMAWGYGKFDIFYELNDILTGRIKYMSDVFKKYSIPIIGRGSYKNILFDNGYFDLIYCAGLLPTIWFFYIQFKTNNILKEKNNISECLLKIFFLLYSMTESYYASVLMNPSLLFFAYFIFENKEFKEEKRHEGICNSTSIQC